MRQRRSDADADLLPLRLRPRLPAASPRRLLRDGDGAKPDAALQIADGISFRSHQMGFRVSAALSLMRHSRVALWYDIDAILQETILLF